MAAFFRIEMLPALHGDCIWIEYGRKDETRYILIDGGPIQAYGALQSRLERLERDRRALELLVITHVDADHIEGAIKLLNHPELNVRFGDVWFNGWPQLEKGIPKAPALSVVPSNDRGTTHGEYLALRITKHGVPWNRRFGGRAIHVAPEAAHLPTLTLAGGMQVTLLGPVPAKLETLRTEWDRVARSIGAEPGDADVYAPKLDAAARYRGAPDPAPAQRGDTERAAQRLDPSIANGSSIAVLLEYEGKRCALLADAHAPETEMALRAAARDRGESVLRLDAMKVSHHGSERNVSDGLLAAVDCTHYLFSSDGSKHGHPDAAAIERIVSGAKKPPHLVFNYRSAQSEPWGAPERQDSMRYRATLPGKGTEGAVIELLQRTATRERG